MRLWDCFVARGYKMVFKSALAMLAAGEEELLLQPFEVLHTSIGDIPKRWFIQQKRARRRTSRLKGESRSFIEEETKGETMNETRLFADGEDDFRSFK